MKPPDFLTSSADFNTIKQQAHPQDWETIKQVFRNYEKDLEPTYGYFALADFNKISERAIHTFMSKLIFLGISQLSSEDIHYAWAEVRTHFLKNYWGFKKLMEMPALHRKANLYEFESISPKMLVSKPAAKVSYKDAFFYIWAVFQSMVITKCLILIFGNELAKDDTLENRIFFGIVIFFSFGSLGFFAWLRRNKKYD